MAAYRCRQPQPQCSHDETESKDTKLINVMFICSEWKSSKGGLSTFNREFATKLAKVSGEKFNIYCYVSESDEADREDARSHGVTLLTAQKLPGYPNSLDWLKIPPPGLPNPDFVIGHGRKFGQPAYFIKHMTNCTWVQFVHVFCEDLGKYKSSTSSKGCSTDTIHENELKHEHEKELCEVADAVVAVGIGLQRKYRRCLPDTKVDVITPGIIDRFPVYRPPEERLNPPNENEMFSIFVFGRAAREDLFVKGYDIIASAVASLGEKFKLTLVGSPPGEQRKLEKWFLRKTNIKRHQLTIHSYVGTETMKGKLKEADLFVLPSRTEGFGIVALEAMSAGVPVLIAYKTGIAEALQKVEHGDSVIVKSDDAGEWAKRIQQLYDQTPEQRHENAIRLRESYMNTYCWETECKKFLALIESLHTEGEPMDNKENVNRQPKQANSNQSVSQGARKRPRREVAGEPDFIPALLQAIIWQYLGRIFGNRSRTESRCLRWGDITLYKHPKTGKERLGFKGANETLEETENEALHSTAVKYLKIFQRHRPPKLNQPQSPFYLAVKNKRRKGDPVWYMEKPQGVNKIGKVPEMKDIGSKHQRLS